MQDCITLKLPSNLRPDFSDPCLIPASDRSDAQLSLPIGRTPGSNCLDKERCGPVTKMVCGMETTVTLVSANDSAETGAGKLWRAHATWMVGTLVRIAVLFPMGP